MSRFRGTLVAITVALRPKQGRMDLHWSCSQPALEPCADYYDTVTVFRDATTCKTSRCKESSAHLFLMSFDSLLPLAHTINSITCGATAAEEDRIMDQVHTCLESLVYHSARKEAQFSASGGIPAESLPGPVLPEGKEAPDFLAACDWRISVGEASLSSLARTCTLISSSLAPSP